MWIAVYLGLLLLPFAILLSGTHPDGAGFAWDFALALGYSGLAIMGTQFWLTARFKRATAPFGIDLIYYFHRYLALVAFAVLLLHATLLQLRFDAAVGSLDPRTAPAYMTLGVVGLLGFAALLVTSLWRKSLRIDYDRWRRWHAALAVLATVAAVVHVEGSGNYLAEPSKRVAWTLLALSWLGLAVYVRLLRPWRLRRQPYRVDAVRQEAGRSWTLSLRPESGPRLAFRAGQFAWLTLRSSPFAMREHPFSFSSNPSSGECLDFTIKELGDFTAGIGATAIGERAYVDGPYGSFGVERHRRASGYVFIAGGVGIAPIISILREMRAKNDRRPLWLFYGNRSWERVVFRDELEDLETTLKLTLVHVLGEPPADWSGERGLVNREVLTRHLPIDISGLHGFVCGPVPMIRLAERCLSDLGLPRAQIHSEIFDLA